MMGDPNQQPLFEGAKDVDQTTKEENGTTTTTTIVISMWKTRKSMQPFRFVKPSLLADTQENDLLWSNFMEDLYKRCVRFSDGIWCFNFLVMLGIFLGLHFWKTPFYHYDDGDTGDDGAYSNNEKNNLNGFWFGVKLVLVLLLETALFVGIFVGENRLWSKLVDTYVLDPTISKWQESFAKMGVQLSHETIVNSSNDCGDFLGWRKKCLRFHKVDGGKFDYSAPKVPDQEEGSSGGKPVV